MQSIKPSLTPFYCRRRGPGRRAQGRRRPQAAPGAGAVRLPLPPGLQRLVWPWPVPRRCGMQVQERVSIHLGALWTAGGAPARPSARAWPSELVAGTRPIPHLTRNTGAHLPLLSCEFVNNKPSCAALCTCPFGEPQCRLAPRPGMGCVSTCPRPQARARAPSTLLQLNQGPALPSGLPLILNDAPLMSRPAHACPWLQRRTPGPSLQRCPTSP
jgi:hypothetical protein